LERQLHTLVAEAAESVVMEAQVEQVKPVAVLVLKAQQHEVVMLLLIPEVVVVEAGLCLLRTLCFLAAATAAAVS
jgi:hypothetical protein